MKWAITLPDGRSVAAEVDMRPLVELVKSIPEGAPIEGLPTEVFLGWTLG